MIEIDSRIVRFLGLFTSLIVFTPILSAQTHMRIYHRGGGHSDVSIEEIDSITFVNNEQSSSDEAELIGSWLWGSTESGYYELLTFNEDNTYTGYDNYFMYGFDTMTYGWYSRYGNLLTLQSNGFGYNHKYSWILMGLMENSLDVMTKMGPFTYNRLQSEIISLCVGDYLECKDEESFVFADGVVVKITDNKLYGIIKGTTYILKSIAHDNCIVGFKVIVD